MRTIPIVSNYLPLRRDPILNAKQVTTEQDLAGVIRSIQSNNAIEFYNATWDLLLKLTSLLFK